MPHQVGLVVAEGSMIGYRHLEEPHQLVVALLLSRRLRQQIIRRRIVRQGPCHHIAAYELCHGVCRQLYVGPDLGKVIIRIVAACSVPQLLRAIAVSVEEYIHFLVLRYEYWVLTPTVPKSLRP